jgi:hypothetical protein
MARKTDATRGPHSGIFLIRKCAPRIGVSRHVEDATRGSRPDILGWTRVDVPKAPRRRFV